MKRQTLFITLALAVSLATAGTTAGDWRLGPDGFGPLRIGMDFAQARKVAGPALKPSDPALLATQGCDQLALPGHRGVALMFVGGVLHRIDLFRPGMRTESGIAPGDALAKLRRIHPGLVSTPNRYDENEAYLTAGPQQGRALRFETRKGKVDRVYAGDWEQVQYVEGCL